VSSKIQEQLGEKKLFERLNFIFDYKFSVFNNLIFLFGCGFCDLIV
jgi:hypothetical protein